MFKKLLLSITIAFTGVLLYAQDGTLDLTFDPGTGVYGAVRASDIQSDGKILIGGTFTNYNGISRNSIARLNTDGSLDTSFDPGTGIGPTTSYPLRAICVRSDGKILIGGTFTTYNGTTVNNIALLNADGSLDVTFNSGTGVNGAIYDIAIQSDGKILIVGSFSSYNGTTRNEIARLNADGSLDLSFNSGSGVDYQIEVIAIQNDGKIIVGGWFTSYNGVSRNNIARLNSDGTIDLSFNPGTGANDDVKSVAIQNNGKIYIGGKFTSYHGTSLNRIARLNQDGSHDPTFNVGTGVDITILTINLQSDEKIIIGGGFISYNGTSINRIARINVDGTLDLSFDPGTGADSDIVCSNIQSDGKIFIGGYFITYNGTSTSRVARINSCNPVSQPSAISGSTDLCDGATETYSVTNDPNADTYNWTLSSGLTGSSTTNSISVTAGSSGGTIEVTAENACGISSAQSISIIINDVTSPVANATTLANITSECSVTSLTAPTATDNCAGSITGTHNATLPISTQGTTLVTWTYNDGNGNTSTQTQNVVIDDVTAPVANATTLSNITSECSVASLTAPTATDNCAGAITGTHNATLPISTQGTTVVTWTYDDGNGNTSTQTQNVVIDDVTAPVANIANLVNITSECSVTSLTAPTATDNCAASISGTHNATLPISSQGTTVVTWTYDDGNGNTSTQTQNVVIDDLTAPVADVTTLANVTSECSVISLTAPTATDNCAGTITGTHNATLPISSQGTTVITWTYDDGNGNTSTQIQNVIITPINNGLTQSGAVTLSADATGYNYQWVDCNNGNQVINGATNQTFIATANGSYAVEIDNGSCTVTSSCVVINQVGIEENSSPNILIYPNPTKGEITISGIDLNTTIEIYNSVGELLKSIIATEFTTMVSISDYSLGVYYVKLKNSSTESIQKLVKH